MIKKTEKAKELLSHSVEELYGISEPTMDKYNAANSNERVYKRRNTFKVSGT